MNSPSASAAKPGTFWYWLGGLVMLSAIVSGGLIVVNALQTMTKTVDSFGRVKVPGGEGCKLVFDKSGRYTIYYEYQTSLPRRAADCSETGETEEITTSAKKPFGLEISLVDADGTEIPTSVSTAGDAGISMNGHIGTALREVTVDQPGDYTLRVGGVTAQSEPFVLAIGRGGIVRVAPYLLGGVALAGLGSVLGIVMIAVTASRRRKGRRLREAQLSVAGGFGVPSFVPGSYPPHVAPPAGLTPRAPSPAPGTSRVLPPTPSLPWNETRSPAMPPTSPPSLVPPPPPPPPARHLLPPPVGSALPPPSTGAARQLPPPTAEGGLQPPAGE